jgi:hypothetical protein
MGVLCTLKALDHPSLTITSECSSFTPSNTQQAVLQSESVLEYKSFFILDVVLERHLEVGVFTLGQLGLLLMGGRYFLAHCKGAGLRQVLLVIRITAR